MLAIEAVAVLGLVGPVHAIAVELAGRDVVQIAVPDVFGALGQFDALELAAALAVEQAQLDLLRIGREQRKIGAPAVPGCTEAGEDVPADNRMRQLSGTRKMAASGGMVRLSSGTRPSNVVDLADVPDIAAAVMRGVGIEHLAPLAGERHPDAIVVIDIRA